MSIVEQSAGREALLRAAVNIPQHVVYRSFAQETVVLNLQTGTYHGLNQTAGRMLEVLEEKPSVALAARTLADEFRRPVNEIESDLAQFCDQLAARGLLEIEGPTA
ncbi:MAG TPA: PqqD family protein [Thermoleophilaceae bacterium]|nr:PqqD family protein [Thermoleophilaceae bacterium]